MTVLRFLLFFDGMSDDVSSFNQNFAAWLLASPTALGPIKKASYITYNSTAKKISSNKNGKILSENWPPNPRIGRSIIFPDSPHTYFSIFPMACFPYSPMARFAIAYFPILWRNQLPTLYFSEIPPSHFFPDNPFHKTLLSKKRKKGTI